MRSYLAAKRFPPTALAEEPMKERTPSVTAGTIAAHRAIESRRPADERICFDPLAERFISASMKVIGESWMPERFALWLYEKMLPGFHTYFAVRTRYLDDYLRSCLDSGIEQLVILGAGYDSRVYRFEKPNRPFRAFEVDHPATQQEKLAKLKVMFASLPSHVSYVPVDFSKEALENKLSASGYDNTKKTLFIWEGVTYYLSAQAVDETLAFVAKNSGKGTSIIFDYTSPSVIDGTAEQREAKVWRRAVRGFGEPLTFGIEAASIENFLQQRGFDKLANATQETLRNAYLTGANQKRFLTSVFNIVYAEADGNASSSRIGASVR
jgi:methyltransferase (TIGR00027 family)